MKRLLTGLVATLLLAPTSIPAQEADSVPDAPSLREIRQRAGFALDRADNLQEEIAAAIEHLIRLRAMSDSAVVRDSILGDRAATDTVRVTDTVRIAPDTVPPSEPPGRPISVVGDSATSIVSWGAADGARWYNWTSSVGSGFTTDTTARIPLNIGDWICLWSNNAAGQNPESNGTCTAVDSVTYLDSLSLYPDSIEMEVGDTVQLTAAVYVRDSIVACAGACDTIPGLGTDQVLAFSDLGTVEVSGRRKRPPLQLPRSLLNPNVRVSAFVIYEDPWP